MQTSILNARGCRLIIPQEFSNFWFYRRAASLLSFTEGFLPENTKRPAAFPTEPIGDRGSVAYFTGHQSQYGGVVAATLGKSGFSTQHNTELDCWSRKINGPIYVAPPRQFA